MKKIIKNVPTAIYMADDGTEFESKQRCLDYEFSKTATAVYVIARSAPQIFSTLEKALATNRNIDTDYIQKVYVDAPHNFINKRS